MSDINLLKKEDSSCTELLECFYDLSANECEAFYKVAAREEVTLDELSSIIGRDRSTTHRLLQKLVGLGLCYKEKKSLERGGYIHVYRAPSVLRVKEQLEKRIAEYMDDLKSLSSKIEYDLSERIEHHRKI